MCEGIVELAERFIVLLPDLEKKIEILDQIIQLVEKLLAGHVPTDSFHDPRRELHTMRVTLHLHKLAKSFDISLEKPVVKKAPSKKKLGVVQDDSN